MMLVLIRLMIKVASVNLLKTILRRDQPAADVWNAYKGAIHSKEDIITYLYISKVQGTIRIGQVTTARYKPESDQTTSFASRLKFSCVACISSMFCLNSSS